MHGSFYCEAANCCSPGCYLLSPLLYYKSNYQSSATIMDGFKHERTLQKKTQVPECPSEPIDDKPTTNALVKRRKEERIGFLLLTRNAYLQMEFLCVRKFAPETQNPSKDQQ
jgi:hypothetical protein